MKYDYTRYAKRDVSGYSIAVLRRSDPILAYNTAKEEAHIYFMEPIEGKVWTWAEPYVVESTYGEVALYKFRKRRIWQSAGITELTPARVRKGGGSSESTISVAVLI